MKAIESTNNLREKQRATKAVWDKERAAETQAQKNAEKKKVKTKQEKVRKQTWRENGSVRGGRTTTTATLQVCGSHPRGFALQVSGSHPRVASLVFPGTKFIVNGKLR